MDYRIAGVDRKTAVKRITELYGEKPVYTKVPRCAFIFRGIVIEKDGNITLEENADMSAFNKLVSEGILVDMAQQSDEADPEQEPDDAGVSSFTVVDVSDTEPRILRPTISVPLEGHSTESILNLIHMIYSKGYLVAKATGGQFNVSDEMLEKLHAEGTGDLGQMIGMIREAGDQGLQGIYFEEDKITFYGFPETTDPDMIHAWTDLVCAITRSSLSQERVRAVKREDTNEKYAFRTWIIRLGMAGTEYKIARNILYRNLEGHTAFRTQEDQEKWNDHQRERRSARKEPDAENPS